ncbi:hypothetical protein, partial [Staphylococcus aureus]
MVLNYHAMENGHLGVILLVTHRDVDQHPDTPSDSLTVCLLEVLSILGQSPLTPTNLPVSNNRHPQYSRQ